MIELAHDTASCAAASLRDDGVQALATQHARARRRRAERENTMIGNRALAGQGDRRGVHHLEVLGQDLVIGQPVVALAAVESRCGSAE